VILELKDKMDLRDAFERKAVHTEEAAARAEGSPQAEAVLALTALGYGNTEALRAVRKAASAIQDADTESLLKAALKELF